MYQSLTNPANPGSPGQISRCRHLWIDSREPHPCCHSHTLSFASSHIRCRSQCEPHRAGRGHQCASKKGSQGEVLWLPSLTGKNPMVCPAMYISLPFWYSPHSGVSLSANGVSQTPAEPRLSSKSTIKTCRISLRYVGLQPAMSEDTATVSSAQ